MPIPIPIIAGAISALGSIGSSLLNRNQTKKQNETDREREQRDLYNQRKYDKMVWGRENAYNSPEEQMNRLRQAGLNPNLVYGKGANNTAFAMQKSSIKPQKRQAPQYDGLGGAASDAFNVALQAAQNKNIQATTDNLHAQNAVIQKEALLKEAQIAKTTSETATNKFQLGQSQELNEQVIRKAHLENELTLSKQIQTDQFTYLAMDKNKREWINSNANNLLTAAKNAKTEQEAKILQDTANSIKNLKSSEAQIKQAEANLRGMGINPSDPTYMRVLLQLLTD